MRFPTIPIREECPPGACVCDRETLLNTPGADLRVLRLTKAEEKKLIGRIERIANYTELKHVAGLIEEQLGVALQIAPGANEVRTMRGINIKLEERPGLCRKTRQAIPAAVRKCLEKNPEIAYAILNAHDLLGGG